jgi:hypothetical protein
MCDYAREKEFMFSRFLITNLESVNALANAAKVINNFNYKRRNF